MASLEDKILGEKLHNYCSSSEESDNENSNSDSENVNKQKCSTEEAAPPPDVNKWEGTSSNTGPKGVIKDWQRYKQLENERREQDEREKVELMKKLTLTVQTTLDEEREKAALEDPELAELLNDDYLVQYQKKHLKQMLRLTNQRIKFGELIILKNGDEFVDAIDKEDRSVTVVVHIYDENVEACRTTNVCLKHLSKLYINVKFCAIVGSRTFMSSDFIANGLPALLVYKGGSLQGNFIRITDQLGNDFQPEDLQGYLVEHGLLEDKSCTPLLIRSSTPDSDSD